MAYSSRMRPACFKMNWASLSAILTLKKSAGSPLAWICSADFSSSFTFGEAKQFESFRRGQQPHASGKNMMARARRSDYQNEEEL